MGAGQAEGAGLLEQPLARQQRTCLAVVVRYLISDLLCHMLTGCAGHIAPGSPAAALLQSGIQVCRLAMGSLLIEASDQVKLPEAGAEDASGALAARMQELCQHGHNLGMLLLYLFNAVPHDEGKLQAVQEGVKLLAQLTATAEPVFSSQASVAAFAPAPGVTALDGPVPRPSVPTGCASGARGGSGGGRPSAGMKRPASCLETDPAPDPNPTAPTVVPGLPQRRCLFPGHVLQLLLGLCWNKGAHCTRFGQ